MITKEHGSWAVLIVPMLVSASIAGKWSTDFILVALAALGSFLNYVPAQILLRHYSGVPQGVEKLRRAKFWGTAYLFATGGFVVPLLLKGYLLLLAVGLTGVMFFFCNFYVVKYYSKMIVSDLIAVAGLTLSGPSVYYVLTGTLNGTAISLYVLNFLFFGCSVFYVHLKIRASGTRKPEIAWREKLSLGKVNLLYYAAVVGGVAVLAVAHIVTPLALVAFIPMVVHGVYGTLKLLTKVHFKKLGFLLLGQSILFGILLSIVL